MCDVWIIIISLFLVREKKINPILYWPGLAIFQFLHMELCSFSRGYIFFFIGKRSLKPRACAGIWITLKLRNIVITSGQGRENLCHFQTISIESSRTKPQVFFKLRVKAIKFYRPISFFIFLLSLHHMLVAWHILPGSDNSFRVA